MEESQDKPAPAPGIDLGDLDALNNLDTARMALRWALERLHSLEKDKTEAADRSKQDLKALARTEEEVRALKQSVALRQREIQEREAYYAKMEELLSLRLSGKLDVESLVREQAETARLQEFLAKKEVELEKAYAAKRDNLELEYSRLISEKKHETQAQARAAEEALSQQRLTLENQHSARLAAVRESEARLKTREHELAERQAHFDQFYAAQRTQLDSDLRRHRQEVEDEVKFRVSGAEEFLKTKHAAAEEAWAREKALYESDLQEKRAELSHKLPYILELEKRLSEAEKMVSEAKPTLELEKEARRRQEGRLREIEAELHARLGEREAAETALRGRFEAELRQARQLWERERERLVSEFAQRDKERGSLNEETFKTLETELSMERRRHEEVLNSNRRSWETERQSLAAALRAREEEADALREKLAQGQIESSRESRTQQAAAEARLRDLSAEKCRQIAEMESRHQSQLAEMEVAHRQKEQALVEAARERPVSVLDAQWRLSVESALAAKYQSERKSLEAQYRSRLEELEAESRRQESRLNDESQRRLNESADRVEKLDSALAEKEKALAEIKQDVRLWKEKFDVQLAASLELERRLDETAEKSMRDQEASARMKERLGNLEEEHKKLDLLYREVNATHEEKVSREVAARDSIINECRRELEESKTQAKNNREALAALRDSWAKEKKELIENVDALQRGMGRTLEEREAFWKSQYQGSLAEFDSAYWAKDEEARAREEAARLERQAEAKKYVEALEERIVKERAALEEKYSSDLKEARDSWLKEKRALIENMAALQEGLGKTLEDKEAFWENQYKGLLSQFDEAYWSKEEEVGRRETVLRLELDKALRSRSESAGRIKELEVRVEEAEERLRQASVIGPPLTQDAGRDESLLEREANLREAEATLQAAQRELQDQAEAFAEIVRQYKDKAEGGDS